MLWTTEHEADIESDLSVFHRIDDPMSLDGPRYFRLALRLAAYIGVIAAVATREQQEGRNGASEAHSAVPTGSAPTPPSQGAVSRVSDDAALAMLADGWVEHVTEGEGE